MSNESQTASNTPSDTVLCKMGCGFFGNAGTEDCCSKCWRENQKKLGAAVACAEAKPPAPVVEAPEPMEVEATEIIETKVEVKMEVTPEVAATPIKKKKKKSYKNLMAGMMKCSPERDVEKEKEQLRKVTGGGAFSKIDKI